jgi:hypothetical protein
MQTIIKRRPALLLSILFALVGLPAGLAGCGSDGCDDPTPALCVRPRDAQGNPAMPTRVEVFQGAASVETIACAEGGFECCSSSIKTGEYRIEVELGGVVQTREVSVVNNYNCSHPVAEETFTF